VPASLSLNTWYRVAPLVLLPGCLVSFNDYPLESTPGAGASTSQGGGGASAGSAGRPPMGGSKSGNAGDANAEAGSDSEPTEGGAGPLIALPATLIDDFEDGDAAIVEHAGRSGSWYAANDGQGMQTPAHGQSVIPTMLGQARGDSRRALHTSGGPFAQWGGLIGSDLATEGDQRLPYDVTPYDGVRFWVRSQPFGPGFTSTVRVNLPTPNTNEGCNPCGDHFGADIPLTSQWVQHEVLFSEMDQAGWGVPQLSTHDRRNVTAIQFAFPENVRFDLWVDDVEFF
jgi:hypothetical protein